MINVCYKNNAFNDHRDIIIMSRMAISEVVDHDHKLSLAILLEIFITLKVVKIMFTNVLSHKKIAAVIMVIGVKKQYYL